jgi:hypothetical protein
MIIKIKYISFLAAQFLLVSLSIAQESVNITGSNAIGSGGSVSYSVGEVLYTSDIGSNGTVDNGVQHAYEIFTFDLKETALNISLSVFPNPTADFLTLQVTKYNNQNLSYQIYDVNGKLFILSDKCPIVISRLNEKYIDYRDFDRLYYSLIAHEEGFSPE